MKLTSFRLNQGIKPVLSSIRPQGNRSLFIGSQENSTRIQVEFQHGNAGQPLGIAARLRKEAQMGVNCLNEIGRFFQGVSISRNSSLHKLIPRPEGQRVRLENQECGIALADIQEGYHQGIRMGQCRSPDQGGSESN